MKDVSKFEKWLVRLGCTILTPTNEYELLRFKGREVGVVYKSGKTSNKYTNQAIICFRKKQKWNGGPVRVGRKPSYRKEKIKLIDRDGTKCFLCGLEMEDDITVEHLIALVRGGKNDLSNMVLMHEKCNREVDILPISEKINITIKKRLKSALMLISDVINVLSKE